MSYEIKGFLYKKFDSVRVTSDFKKQDIVIDTGGDYPQQIKIEFTQDKTELLSDLQEGEELTVSFNLRGREWNGKYFVNLHGWRIERAVAPPLHPAKQQQEQLEGDDEDLPF